MYYIFYIHKKAHIGIKGIVRDAKTGIPIEGASIKVKNVTNGVNKMINHDIYSGNHLIDI